MSTQANKKPQSLARVNKQLVDSAKSPQSSTRGGSCFLPAPADGPLSSPAEACGFAVRFSLAASGRRCPTVCVRITAADKELRLDVHVGPQQLFAGDWSTSLTWAGKVLNPVGPWELVCRHSSRRVSYLEASQEWTGGVTLWRHVLLAREDGWLIVGEAVTGGRREDRWGYASRLSLGGHIGWRSVTRHTEGWLLDRSQRRARVLPVFASEWKETSAPPPLSVKAGALVITGCFDGAAFFAPVWFDLSTSRVHMGCTWRQLTVAQDRAAVPNDVAVAYRVQVGGEHWLLYRTLAPAAKRSFFGHQLVSDLLFARFDREKGVLPLLELVQVPD